MQKSLKLITTKALWKGSKLSKTANGKKLKLGSTTIGLTKTGAAVIFFYDTDDHKLEIAKAKAAAANSLTAFSIKTVATVTLHNGASFTAGDILVF